jgi:hypothetical protein
VTPLLSIRTHHSPQLIHTKLEGVDARDGQVSNRSTIKLLSIVTLHNTKVRRGAVVRSS